MILLCKIHFSLHIVPLNSKRKSLGLHYALNLFYIIELNILYDILRIMKRALELYQVFISDNRKWLRLVLIWFGISILIGVATFFVYPELLEEILKQFEEKFGPERALDFSMVMDIFLNNIGVAGIGIVGGFILGIGPFLVVVVNGFLLGFITISVFNIMSGDFFSALWFLILGLLPHGILEIPAFLVAAVLGLRLGMNWTKAERGSRFAVFKKDFLYTAKGFVIITLVLFLAALIEVYVTGNLLN